MTSTQTISQDTYLGPGEQLATAIEPYIQNGTVTMEALLSMLALQEKTPTHPLVTYPIGLEAPQTTLAPVYTHLRHIIAEIVGDPIVHGLAKELDHGQSTILADWKTQMWRNEEFVHMRLKPTLTSLIGQYAAASPQHLQALLRKEFMELKAGHHGLFSIGDYIHFLEKAVPNTLTLRQEESHTILTEFIAAHLPQDSVKKFPLVLAMLTSQDRYALNALYVQDFVEEHMVDNTAQVSSGAIEKMKRFLGMSAMEECPFLTGWPAPMNEHIDPIADILRQGYPPEEVVAALGLYQSNLMLEGSIDPKELVSDLPAYIQSRTTRVPTVLELESQLDDMNWD